MKKLENGKRKEWEKLDPRILKGKLPYPYYLSMDDFFDFCMFCLERYPELRRIGRKRKMLGTRFVLKD